jgi:hypothetical protein
MVERISINGETDPDGLAKDQGEEDVAQFFGEQFEAQFDDLLNEINTEEPEQISPDFWKKWAAIFLAFLIPTLADFATTSAETGIDDSGIGVDQEAIVAAAAQFSETHAFNLVTDLNNTTQRNLQRVMANFFQSEARDVDLLKKQLAPIFGTGRAENIAITETTRAFEVGKEIYRDQLAAQGIRTDLRWHTMRDERVCVICEPNEGKLKSEGWTVNSIPAHPRDRCWTTIEIVVDQ